MGWSLPSHIDQGFVFGLLGMWHVFSILRSFLDRPKEFKSRTWYPGPWHSSLRCVELWVLLTIVVLFISKQLSHATEDLASGVIQSKHLMRFQHVTFALFFLIYVVVALIHANLTLLPPLPEGVLNATFALGFLMELIIFHFGHHPGDSLESYVHMLMQLVLVTLISMMFLEILYPHSFIVALGRSMCLTLKGTWFFHIGLLINSPSCVPLGCTIPIGEDFPACLHPMDNMRAKSIQVLVFAIQAAGIVSATYVAYAFLLGINCLEPYGVAPKIKPLLKEHNHQIYFVVDAEKDLHNVIDADDVPIVKDLRRSLSKRFTANAASSPVSVV